MNSSPTSTASPSPVQSLTMQPTTSLEIALSILLSNSQPITIRNALAAYIQAADFTASTTFYTGFADDIATVEDAVIAFEHALDKHPLPLGAMPVVSAAPAPRRPAKKKTVRTKTKMTKVKSSTARLTIDIDVTVETSVNAPSSSTMDPVAYRRPFINEVDQLRREYYTEKAQSVLQAGAYKCTCGKCGDPVLDLGGYVYDAAGVPTGEAGAHAYGAPTGPGYVYEHDVPAWEAQRDAMMTEDYVVDAVAGVDENGFYLTCDFGDVKRTSVASPPALSY